MPDLSELRFNYKKFCDKFALSFYAVFFLLAFTSSALAQSQNYISKRLIPVKNTNNIYEIGKVDFTGNYSLTNEALYKIVSSRASERTTPQQILSYFADQFEVNPSVPAHFKEGIQQSLKNLYQDIQYFSSDKAATDIENIRKFYNQYGFHNVDIFYTFVPDFDNNINVLSFHISENKRRKMDRINYIGLSSLPSKVSAQVESKKIILGADYFNEFKVINEADLINKCLLDAGYFYSQYSTPLVTIGEELDSVSVEFDTGKRQKIGTITYVDSLRKQKALARTMKA